MATYARLTLEGTFERTVELTAEQYAAMEANGKSAWLRLWFVDPRPTPTSTQVVELGPVSITQVEARQTWVLREKTPAEVEADAIAAEQAKLEEVLADLAVQRAVPREQWDGYSAAQLRSEQWRDRQALLRAAHFLVRRVRANP